MEKIKKLGIVFGIIIISLVIISASGLSIEYQRETQLSQNIDDMNDKIAELTTLIQASQEELLQVSQEVASLQSGNNYELHDPTYNEVLTFIEDDKTESDLDLLLLNHYLNYAISLNENAKLKGIRSCIVYIILDSGTIHINGFNTTDKGMIYFDSTKDEQVENVKVGKEYWTECIIPKYGLPYEDDPNDRISDIIIYW